DPQRRALAGPGARRPETLVGEYRAPGCLGARGPEPGHGHGDRVIHDGLGLVDNRRGQVVEAKAGHELTELDRQRFRGPHGQRRAAQRPPPAWASARMASAAFSATMY